MRIDIDADIIGENLDHMVDALTDYGCKTRLTLKIEFFMASMCLHLNYAGGCPKAVTDQDRANVKRLNDAYKKYCLGSTGNENNEVIDY